MLKPKAGYSGSHKTKVEKKPLLNGDAQPQNYKTGRVYLFGNDDEYLAEDSGDNTVEFEMAKIRSRKGKNGEELERETELQKVTYIERPVFKNDNLSKFSLQYGCTVAELKVANNLYNTQDFYALKNIKIPIQPHGLLTERVEEEKRRENAFADHENRRVSNNSESDYEDLERNTNSNIRTVSISANLKDTERFLKRMDDDIHKICESVSSREPDLEHVTRKLNAKCIRPRYSSQKEPNELGSIWSGCGWKSAVAMFVFVGIILPLMYFIYVEKFKS